MVERDMNITELARRLKIPTEQLKDIVPRLGFDIGRRAIKVDDRVAGNILRTLSDPAVRKKYLTVPIDEQREEEEKSTGVVLKEGVAQIPDTITVKDLALQLHTPVSQLMITLMRNGVMAAQNEKIDFETAAIVAEDCGYTAERIVLSEDHTSDEKARQQEALLEVRDSARALARPPVVVVMGHVDHGKTKLLDAIRKTNVVAQEYGGITQHIGAYQVTVQSKDEPSLTARDETSKGRIITFIDTPGHEAFTAMRSRGARVADIAILVVAADDGVQPQTIEALSHIQRAELPFIVAINKIDKEGANSDRVKQGLAQVNVQVEDWGGKVPLVPVSALKGTGIEQLLEMVILVSDMHKENIVADPAQAAVGTIIESHIDKGEGPVATVLIQHGTLKLGSFVQVGDTYGKIKAMRDFLGKALGAAPPSTPVKILGLRSVPQVGDVLAVREDATRFVREVRKVKKRKGVPEVVQSRLIQHEDLGGDTRVNIVVKADVLGSLEAILEALEPIQSQSGEVLQYAYKGLGALTDVDVYRAAEQGAMLLGFNVPVTPAAEEVARTKNITIQTSTVIYDLVDVVKTAVEKALPPEIIRTDVGTARVLKIFKTGTSDAVIGAVVIQGRIEADALFEIHRGKEPVRRGKLVELQAGKQAVREVVEGQECGLHIEGLNDVREGDMLLFYREQKKARTIQL